MFEHILFQTYHTPIPMTTLALNYNLAHNRSSTYLGLSIEDDVEPFSEKLDQLDFTISGKIQAFIRPPVSDFTLENLYHMESFSLFTNDYRSFTRRSNLNSYLIVYTYEGSGILEYQGKSYSMEAGEGFFIDCKLPHYYKTNSDVWMHSTLNINGPLLPSVWAEYSKNNSVCFSQPTTGKYQQHLEELLKIYSSTVPHRDWKAANCISNLLTELLEISHTNSHQKTSMPENLYYLLKYMEHNFSNPLTLDFLAKFSGISKYHLTREFKKYMKFTPIDYLIHLRIEQSKVLLISTCIPVFQIACMVGVPDINNFINLFRKKCGMTPGEYRKLEGVKFFL